MGLLILEIAKTKVHPLTVPAIVLDTSAVLQDVREAQVLVQDRADFLMESLTPVTVGQVVAVDVVEDAAGVDPGRSLRGGALLSGVRRECGVKLGL